MTQVEIWRYCRRCKPTSDRHFIYRYFCSRFISIRRTPPQNHKTCLQNQCKTANSSLYSHPEAAAAVLVRSSRRRSPYRLSFSRPLYFSPHESCRRQFSLPLRPPNSRTKGRTGVGIIHPQCGRLCHPQHCCLFVDGFSSCRRR